MIKYPTHLDEIDQWLYDSFGILPGCCSSTENLRYNTARMVAEVLWPNNHFRESTKKITMTREQALEVLKAHNEWRRYNGPIGEGLEMQDPTIIGQAIDVAIDALVCLTSHVEKEYYGQ